MGADKNINSNNDRRNEGLPETEADSNTPEVATNKSTVVTFILLMISDDYCTSLPIAIYLYI